MDRTQYLTFTCHWDLRINFILILSCNCLLSAWFADKDSLIFLKHIVDSCLPRDLYVDIFYTQYHNCIRIVYLRHLVPLAALCSRTLVE